MTIQAWRLLEILKKVQEIEDDSGGVLTKDFKVGKIADKDGLKSRTINIRFFKNSLNSTLKYLEEKKYIQLWVMAENLDGNTLYAYKVLHGGWHIYQSMLSILFRSVALPVIISLLTSVCTYYLIPSSENQNNNASDESNHEQNYQLEERFNLDIPEVDHQKIED